ncbi:hypothetical protein [Trueperella pyogenes]|uniref:hypothetical protein n=1 Tax=Trueperella pyogenes TaxID=1661 RepID=UPI000D25A6C7|nr:hypothetical protein [Trueperella pyogenes]AWA43725.1 hypothetical protein DBV13_06710 [Trueperella pyogenes]MDF2420877.1 hypothetical protein [Trueperella pyogenes]
MRDQLIAPAGPATAWWVIFVVSLVAFAGVVGFAAWYWRYEPTPRVKVAPVQASDRQRWVARIDDVVARHPAETPEQVRALYLALAAELRAMLGERSRADLSCWQVSQLRQVREFREVADVIGSWEEPSFSAQPHASAQLAQEQAYRVVMAW